CSQRRTEAVAESRVTLNVVPNRFAIQAPPLRCRGIESSAKPIVPARAGGVEPASPAVKHIDIARIFDCLDAIPSFFPRSSDCQVIDPVCIEIAGSERMAKSIESVLIDVERWKNAAKLRSAPKIGRDEVLDAVEIQSVRRAEDHI